HCACKSSRCPAAISLFHYIPGSRQFVESSLFLLCCSSSLSHFSSLVSAPPGASPAGLQGHHGSQVERCRRCFLVAPQGVSEC
ncbi:uncharacterized protein B0H64DRAFT_362306, partial [Chaetomium fimeti]